MKIQSILMSNVFTKQNNLNKSISFGGMVEDMEDEEDYKRTYTDIYGHPPIQPDCDACKVTFAKNLIAMLVKNGIMKAVSDPTNVSFERTGNKLNLVLEADGTVKKLDLNKPTITTPEKGTTKIDLPDSFSVKSDGKIKFSKTGYEEEVNIIPQRVLETVSVEEKI